MKLKQKQFHGKVLLNKLCGFYCYFLPFLQELGVLDHPSYKICFLLDSGAMITVLSSKYGVIEVCQPLNSIIKSNKSYEAILSNCNISPKKNFGI